MKAVMLVKAYDPVTKELGEIQCCQVKKPELVHEDDVLIKVAYASVCGSDPHLLEGMGGDPEAGMYAAYYGPGPENRQKAQALLETIQTLVKQPEPIYQLLEQEGDQIPWD